MPVFDPLKKLRYFRDWFRPRPSDSYIESVPEPTVTYPNQVYEDRVHSFIGGEEQTYRDMQLEIDRHVSHISIPMQAEHLAQASVPELQAEEIFAEHEPVTDAELIEMAIEAVKEDTSDELEDSGFGGNGLEDIEQAFDQPDALVEPALEEMVEEMMYDQAMDEPEMEEDAQQADHTPLEADPFFLGG